MFGFFGFDVVKRFFRKGRRIDWYGVEWNIQNSDPIVTRIGNSFLHRTLPVQSGMYACLLNDDGTENYRLNPVDWNYKLDGSAAVKDGTDGQVMIFVPGYYFLAESEGDIRRWKISARPQPGFIYNSPQYVSAYETALNRSTLKLSSVKNATTTYRGGDNTSTWDSETRTLLGRPVANLSRTLFREYARNRGNGWEIDNYFLQRTLIRFFVIEFATRNSQLTINAALDVNGYKQGGLGLGVTNLDGTLWNTFNSYNPFIPCGHSDSIASGTGEVAYTMPSAYGSLVTYVNRYRGIELPFGHIWKNIDGIMINIFSNLESTPVSEGFIATDKSKWNDTNLTGYKKVGELPRSNGYVKELLKGELLPLSIGGGSSTYWADYWYTSLPSSGNSMRTVLLGGSANNGALAGLGCSNSFYSPSYSAASFGSRLCFLQNCEG